MNHRDDPDKLWTFLMETEELIELPFSQSMKYLGVLIDLSLDLERVEGLEHAQSWAEDLSSREIAGREKSLLHYFRSNIWANIAYIREISSGESGQDENVDMEIWKWERIESEKQIYHLRSALLEDGFHELSVFRQCQVLTNLANLYDKVGRFVEALEYWRRAISVSSSFGPASGNLGMGLAHYANSLYDPGHQVVFLKKSLAYLKSALETQLHPNARQSFEEKRLEILARLSSDFEKQDFDLENYSLGDSGSEIEYRKWCLSKGLFLNPLNDLGPYPIAARDIFTAPSIVYGLGENPSYHGFFNQMKQEYVSARYFFYEGIHAKSIHFSDKGVLLYNTLDYPLYSLAAEKMRAAFRLTYSLFDKIAYFLNAYLSLGIPEKRVNFRTFWYEKQRRERGLKPDLRGRQNWPLRGLFWLSKDLFEDKEGFKDSTEPGARDLADIRNHLEHKYLKLHNESLSLGEPKTADGVPISEFSSIFEDDLALSLYHKDFETKTLRLLKLVRAALIYLSLAIHREEYLRQQKSNQQGIIVGQYLDIWADEWKF
jgi:hypothetical protein